MKKTFLISCVIFAICILLSGCSGEQASQIQDQNTDNNVLDLKYATQFSVSSESDGIYQLDIEDGRKYILISDEADENFLEADRKYEDYTRIDIPVSSVYMAASSVMDMFRELDALDVVELTSTNEWSIDGIDERLSDGRMYYIGKYMAPDYEALLESECDLALESTMIYHSPATAEEIEALNIPVLIERSSYENDPLARLEWIKLYGLLLDKEEDAKSFFDEAEKAVLKTVEKTDTDKLKNPSVAFFSISSSGYATVRKPGDYLVKMIEMAGGSYIPDDIIPENGNAAATMNIQMEAFVEAASDADILIYNSAIRNGPQTIAELLERSEVFENFKAVEAGNVWCTKKSMFQAATAVAGIISELDQIISGDNDAKDMEFFYKLK